MFAKLESRIVLTVLFVNAATLETKRLFEVLSEPNLQTEYRVKMLYPQQLPVNFTGPKST